MIDVNMFNFRVSQGKHIVKSEVKVFTMGSQIFLLQIRVEKMLIISTVHIS